MKLDDRDIICETDYSPLSGEELVTQIEWHAAAMSGATAYDLERITGPARALLARAEVLEVAFANSHELNETLGNENRALLARAVAAEAEASRLRDEVGERRMMDTDMEAFQREMERLRGAYIFDIRPACEMYRALMARAEAAEASRDALADRLVFEMEQRETLAARAEAAERERDDANKEVALEQANAREAWERVAELEALMALGVDVPPPDDGRVGEAAQQWRPVTESEPYDDDVEIIVVASRSGVDGVWYYADETEDGINLWQEPRLWRPLPTPPATAEATE